jgi:hypothetical protein
MRSQPLARFPSHSTVPGSQGGGLGDPAVLVSQDSRTSQGSSTSDLALVAIEEAPRSASSAARPDPHGTLDGLAALRLDRDLLLNQPCVTLLHRFLVFVW